MFPEHLFYGTSTVGTSGTVAGVFLGFEYGGVSKLYGEIKCNYFIIVS